MPLYDNAVILIRNNLISIQNCIKAPIQTIGFFTDKQFSDINTQRSSVSLPSLGSNKIVFVGSHLYKSRCIKDKYTIDDVLLQIISSLDDTSIITATRGMTRLDSVVSRSDGYNNLVNDRAIFELTSKHPDAELFSVMPKGDLNKPDAKKHTI